MKGKRYVICAILALSVLALTGCDVGGEMEENVICQLEDYAPTIVCPEPEVAELQRRLARWYNLNLISTSPEQGYSTTFGAIIPSEDGVLWVVELENGWFVPVYDSSAGEMIRFGFRHGEGSAFPVGSAGENAVLHWYPIMTDAGDWCERLGLTQGRMLWMHILGERVLYTVESVSESEPVEGISPLESCCTLVIVDAGGGVVWIRCVRC